MYTYIRKQHKGYYLETETLIDAQYWAGQIGTTYNDFLAGKWILLSEEQVSFHQEYPYATIKEVLDMQIAPQQEVTLLLAKYEKIDLIDEYDSSDAVNSFDIIMNGDTISTWITPDLRSNYKNSLDSAELLGLTEVHPVFNNILLTLPIQIAKTALAQILIYADRCYIVTQTHKHNIETLDTVDAVNAYDYTVGYPERLTFNI